MAPGWTQNLPAGLIDFRGFTKSPKIIAQNGGVGFRAGLLPGPPMPAEEATQRLLGDTAAFDAPLAGSAGPLAAA